MSVYHNIYQYKVDEKDKEISLNSERSEDFFKILFYNAVISSFKWLNLPDKTLLHMPEEQLCYSGRTAYFIDDDGEHRIFPCVPSGELDVNGEYSQYQIIARNGKMWLRKRDEIEICYNNSMRIPSTFIISTMADKTSYALSCVDSALEKAMLPVILTGSINEKLSAFADLYNKNANLKPFRIAFDDTISKNDVETLNLFDNNKYDIGALWDTFVRYRNLFYTTIGINNVEITKRERLVENEADGNDEIVRYTLFDDMYNNRKNFCERVNKKFGVNLDVEPNRSVDTVYEVTIPVEQQIENLEIERGVDDVSETEILTDS